ncbi:MAG: pseudoazurin [Cohaesibacter sp.]|nr:pseudoazurin [Cohaesibacter sp.]
MKLTSAIRLGVGASILAVASLSAMPAFAETFEVQMLNKDPENKKNKNIFKPAFLKINVGDTVKFISVDKGHNSQSVKGMLPEGAKKWKSKISKDFEITFDVEGTYGYKCTPHYSMGMVGVIVVGDGSSNLDAAKSAKAPKKAAKAFAPLFEQAAAQ